MPSEDRLRSLARINHSLRAVGGLDEHIHRLLEKQPGRVEVLEVGFGYGGVLLELSWLFRDREVGFHGVDLNRYVDGPEQLRGDRRDLRDNPERGSSHRADAGAGLLRRDPSAVR